MSDVSTHRAGPRSKFKIARERFGRLSLSEKALLALSAHPDDVDKTSSYKKPSAQWTTANALATLQEAYPDFLNAIAGKRVLDYGSGDGFQAVALRQKGASHVVGAELEENRRDHAVRLAAELGVDGVSFSEKAEGAFDVVVSLNAMEHFVDPAGNLREILDYLAPGGRAFISFGPPWMAPYGHHMHFFCRWPWINLLFSEATVMKIRQLYRDDDATTYEPGLNRMTIAKCEALLEDAGCRVIEREYCCAWNLNFFRQLGPLRELFINQVNLIVARA